MMKTESIYKTLETKFIDLLAKELKIEWQMETPESIKKAGIKLDAYGEKDNEVYIAEVYATLGEIKSAKKTKILADSMKMLYAEKLLDGKNVNKYFITVKDKEFNGKIENIWQLKAIEKMGIKIRYYQLTDDEKEGLKEAIEQNKKNVKEKTL